MSRSTALDYVLGAVLAALVCLLVLVVAGEVHRAATYDHATDPAAQCRATGGVWVRRHYMRGRGGDCVAPFKVTP